MEKKYVNYYNGEDTNITFFFDGLDEENAKIIQAYLLQDSHFIISDENVLSKISENKENYLRDTNLETGVININSDPRDKGHFTIKGCSKCIDFQGDETKYIYRGDIFIGLNFVSVTGHREDTKTKELMFSEVTWCYEKSHNPKKLIRHNIKTTPLSSTIDSYDLEGGDIEYSVCEEFNIKNNPTEIFKTAKKEVKVKTI